MVISLSHRFIFVHIYKTGGTSVAAALEPYAHDSRMLLLNRMIRKLGLGVAVPSYRYQNYDRLKHARARRLRNELPPRIWDGYYKFAFVRNPWDWHVSIYHYLLQKPDNALHPFVRAMSGFEEFLEWKVSEHRRLQKDFVTDEDGRLIVDFVGKVEHLEEDFRHVCRVLHLDAELPHLNRSAHRDYRACYNARTRRLIEAHFEEDIEFFGYSFDNGDLRPAAEVSSDLAARIAPSWR